MRRFADYVRIRGADNKLTNVMIDDKFCSLLLSFIRRVQYANEEKQKSKRKKKKTKTETSIVCPLICISFIPRKLQFD